jgi:ABC-type dipeptide/oligopeptide/nickel transport system ATPase component
MKTVLLDPQDVRIEGLKQLYPEAFVGNMLNKEEFLEILGISEEEAAEEEVQEDAEQAQEDSIWLVPWIQRRLSQNRNANLVFVGDTGSGKSYSSISLAEKIDPNFSAERIVFTTLDFLKLINSNLPPGSVVIFDDAGLGIPARQWQETSAKIFGKLFQGFRYKNLVSMITVPDLSFIERQSRKLMHLYLEATDTQGIMKPFRPFSPFRGEDRLGFRYPTMERGGREIKIKASVYSLPSKQITTDYEAKKLEYMERTNREFQEEMEYAMEREAHRREEMQKQREKWKNKKNREQKKKEKARKAMELKQQGLTERQIARKMKVGNASVHRLLEQSGAVGE